jgi:hypothetical protein
MSKTKDPNPDLPPRTGCPDLDPNWTVYGRPRGPTLCVIYPDCQCGKEDKKRGRPFAKRHWEKQGD